MELDEKSSNLTTFLTPFGRLRFIRVPFGINSAPEMFQRNMVKIFGDIPGVIVYFDDVGIMGATEEEHDTALSLVLERARLNGVQFNPEKSQYRQSRVEFMGHVSSFVDVLRLLRLFKYLAKHIPNLSKKSANLRHLTRNDVDFEWNDKHESELHKYLFIRPSSDNL